MKHPQTRLERELTEEKAFNKKLKCVRNGSYPCRYTIQYKDKTLKKNWDYRRYSWRVVAGAYDEYAKYTYYFKELSRTGNKKWFKNYSNRIVRRNKNFSTKKSNSYRKVFELWWSIT